MSPIENRKDVLDRVLRRGTRLRRRRQLTGAGAAVAVVVLLGVAIAVTSKENDTVVAAGRSTSTTTTIATATLVPLPTMPSTAVGQPTTTIAVADQRPSTTTSPAGAPTTTSGARSGCRNSTDEACGPARWDPAPAANQPMTVHVTPSTSAPKAGEAVTFTVAVSDPDARVDRDCNSLVTYGDGQGPPGCATTASCVARFGAWTPPERRGDRYEVTYAHTYATSGDVTATFTFTSHSDICGPDDPYGSTATGEVLLHVTA